ncbi:MAG: [FeFe] hydrogenase H-cluster maturation GTPase HydF [Bacteroidales bacterium]
MNSLINIGIFGRTNTGKSSLINRVTEQDFAIVSEKAGTTTDPIKKRLEIFGLGPCQLIDTAGIGDSSELGEKRIKKTFDIINQIDLALLLFTGDSSINMNSLAEVDLDKDEQEFLAKIQDKDIPVILVYNKVDIWPLSVENRNKIKEKYGLPVVVFSDHADEEVRKVLTDTIIEKASSARFHEKTPFEGLLETKGLNLMLICPVDSEAPTGRLILPQVQAIRDALDYKCIATVLEPNNITNYLKNNPDPYMAVTDSQAFAEVSKLVPERIPLTSFSMLLARAKGCFEEYIKGTPEISKLKDGSKILILESCTHHSSCEDIGRVKLPKLFREFTGKKLKFDLIPGLDRIDNIESYDMVAQCGGCMVTGRQLYQRLKPAMAAGVPVTNYGMAISYMNGIFDRAVKPLMK